jgi:hypothetical protein
MRFPQSIIKTISTQLAWDLVELQSDSTLFVDKFEIGNSSGSTCEVGWGFEGDVEVGQDETTYAEVSLPVTLSASDLIIWSSRPINAFTLNVTTSDADAITVTYWDGSAWSAVATAIIAPVVSSTGIKPAIYYNSTPGRVSDAANATYPRGKYGIKIAGGAGAIISAIRVGEVKDRILVLADGNSTYESYDQAGLQGNRNYGVFAYITTANADNYVNVDHHFV